MQKSSRYARYFFVNALQYGQKLLDAKAAEGAAALEWGDMQGHVGGLIEYLGG